MESKIINLEQALKEHEFYNFITGDSKYSFTCQYANMPTDPHQVFDVILKYYNQSDDKRILQDFIFQIIVMSNDKDYSWLSLYYLASLLRFKIRSQVDMDLSPLITEIQKNLIKHKDELLNDYRWVGADNSKGGLWADVERMTQNVNDEFGYLLAW